MTPFHRSQRGFAAIAAVFLVVGLAALGAFMVTMSNTQQLTSATDLQGTKAYWAARAGLEWGVAAAKSGSGCPAASTALSLDGFTVDTTCSAAAYSDGGGTKTIVLIVATARPTGSSAGNLGYVERSITASLEF